MLEAIEPIQNRFWEFHFIRGSSSNGVVASFDPIQIESHMRLSGEELSPWEYKLIMELDLIFRATILERR